MNDNSFTSELENKRRTIKRKRLGRFLMVLILWGFIGIYFITPLSKVSTPYVKGTVYITKSQIISASALKYQKGTYIWNIDTNKHKQALSASNPYFLKDVRISKNLRGVFINVEEIYPVAKIDETYLLSNDTLLNPSQINAEIMQHLLDYNGGNVLNMTPTLTGTYQGIAQHLKESNPHLLNHFVTSIAITQLSSSMRTTLTLNDERISRSVQIHFLQQKDISKFLSENEYLSAIKIINQSTTDEFFFANKTLVKND